MLKKIGIGLAALIAAVPGIYLLFIRPAGGESHCTDV